MSGIYVGMSGWQFPGWRGGFYPKDLVQRRELEYASRQVTSIEINGTFYSLQKPESFQNWFDQTPENFVFALKAPQFITHVRRLKEVDEPVATFLASGVFRLKQKLGPILWQFPPNVMLKDDRFRKFMELLPYDSKAASRLAKKHSAKIKGRTETKLSGDLPVRHAFEFRHPSFMDPKFLELMRKHGVAVVIAHSGMKSPYTEEITADFIYARMHGQESKFKKGYSEKFLNEWARKIKTWNSKRDAFIYFDTEAKEFAPQDALNLISCFKK